MIAPDSRALAHRDDPDTSHAAATATRRNALVVKRAILFLLTTTPQTAEELTRSYFYTRHLAGWPDVKSDSIAKRLSELRVAGLVVDTGERHDTSYGRTAVVWRLADK